MGAPIVKEYIIRHDVPSVPTIPINNNSTVLIDLGLDATCTVHQSISDEIIHRLPNPTDITFSTLTPAFMRNDTENFTTVTSGDSFEVYATDLNDGTFYINGISGNQLIVIRTDGVLGDVFQPEVVTNPHMIFYRNIDFFQTHSLGAGGHQLFHFNEHRKHPTALRIIRTGGTNDIKIKVKRNG